MLVSFGARNFYSFKQGFDISFSLPSGADNIANKDNISYILGIKGSNGSGKTNLIKCLDFYFSFVCRIPSKENEFSHYFEPFFGNKKKSEFYFEFLKNGIYYTHEFIIYNGKVSHEEITRKDKRKTVLIRRNSDNIVECLKSLDELKSIKLNPKSSLLTVFKTHKFKTSLTELRRVQDLASLILTNVSSLSGYSDFSLNEESVSQRYSEDNFYKNLVVEVLNFADNGIKEIEIRESKNEKGETVYYPVFIRDHEGKKYETLYYQESNGNQKLYKVIHLYALALRYGGILALDEFDIHLHAMILPKILEIFEENNPNSAQFIFTAHNTEIIDTLGKYRTILVNKDDNESYCYRLDEIPGTLIRNDRPISPLYSANKIGGTPFNEKI